MRDIKEMLKDYVDDADISDEEYAFCTEILSLVESGPSIVKHKVVISNDIYRNIEDNKHYCVTSRYVNNGYWRDSDRLETLVNEVRPVQVVVTKYEEI